MPSEPLAAAVGYYQRYGAALFRLLDDPDVPIDNSPAEREFQTVAKRRLNMLFAGRTSRPPRSSGRRADRALGKVVGPA